VFTLYKRRTSTCTPYMYHSVNTALMLVNRCVSVYLSRYREGPILVNYSSVFWYHRLLWLIFQNTNSAWNHQQ